MTEKTAAPRERGIYSATPPRQVLHHAEILVLQQMSDTLRRLADAQEKISDDVVAVKDRLTKIESAGLGEQLITLGQSLERACARIDVLEADKDKRSGMAELLGFVSRSAPWIATLAIGAWAYVTKR
jgi:lipoate-protein ligase A